MPHAVVLPQLRAGIPGQALQLSTGDTVERVRWVTVVLSGWAGQEGVLLTPHVPRDWGHLVTDACMCPSFFGHHGTNTLMPAFMFFGVPSCDSPEENVPSGHPRVLLESRLMAYVIIWFSNGCTGAPLTGVPGTLPEGLACDE